MYNRIKILLVLFFISIIASAQSKNAYEIHLGLGRHQKNIDEYGNVLPYGKEIDKDILYIEQPEFNYILNRSTYGNGVLRGSFNINNKIYWNGEIVNTTWTLMSHRFHIMIQSIDDDTRYYYNIPVSELKSKVKNRY